MKIFFERPERYFCFAKCNICMNFTLFSYSSDNCGLPRETFKCKRCGSKARERAVKFVLDNYISAWQTMKIHEFSPRRLEQVYLSCPNYTYSYYDKEKTSGESFDERGTYQDLERTTFPTDYFDIILLQEVVEHFVHPEKCFHELKRILKPEGKIIITIPVNDNIYTMPRITEKKGKIEYTQPKIMHGDPINKGGILMTMEYGCDFMEYLYNMCGFELKRYTFSPFADEDSNVNNCAFEGKSIGIYGYGVDVFWGGYNNVSS